MGKKPRGGRGRGGGGDDGGRGRGGFGDRGRGRGRGRGLGFVPFSGQGHTLGGDSPSPYASSSGYNSPRGGGSFGGRGRPYRGRGRGGNLAVQGQNRVAFDYGDLARPRVHLYTDNNDNGEDVDEDDFAIEVHSKYRHRTKPHLEIQEVSDPEGVARSSANARAIGEAVSTQVAAIIPIGSRPADGPELLTPNRNFKSRFSRGSTPTSFPEYRTSRGGPSGYSSRPPEETEDARYLAGVPGLRRVERQPRRQRFGDPADAAQSVLRKPVAFVKASGLYPDPLKDPNLEQQQQDPDALMAAAKQLEEARQQTQHAFDPASHPTKHAGLGFSTSHSKPSEPNSEPTPVRPATPTFDFEGFNDDAMEQDEVDALLSAFPGSKQLAPGESMFDDAVPALSYAGFEHTPVPAAAAPGFPKNGSPPEALPVDTHMNVSQVVVATETTTAVQPAESKSPLPGINEQETIVEALVGADAQRPADPESLPIASDGPVEAAGDDLADLEPTSMEAAGFTIDLIGDDTLEASEPIVLDRSSDRVVLGDVAVSAPFAAGSSTSAPTSKKSASSRRRRLRRVPREGDSDLDWGSDGPPDAIHSDDNKDEQYLVTAAAGITFNDADAAAPQREDDAILARALHADRNAWESLEQNFVSIQPRVNGKSRKKHGAQRAKQRGPSRAAQLRDALQQARSRKAHEDAVVADYMENLARQAAEDESEEENAEVNGLFEDHGVEGDMTVETMDGDLAANSSSKGKQRATPLSEKLDEQTQLDAMIRFMNGMDPQKGGKQMSFGDIDDENYVAEVKEWLTESEDDEDDEDDSDDDNGDVDATIEHSRVAVDSTSDSDSDEDEELAEQLRIILEEDDDDEDDSDDFDDSSDSEDSTEDDVVNVKQTRANLDSDDSDSGSDDEDEGMFRGNKSSWADEDEDFIAALTSQLGSGKRSQKKLFKAISRGDFSDMVDDSIEIDSDDPAYGLGSVPTARNGKRKGRKWNGDDLWAEQLQQQWDKDRASKATKKQQRAMEKAAAALNPFPNTHGVHGKKSKKMAKQARRAETREARANLKAHSNNVLAAVQAAGSIDAVDQSLLNFGGRGGNDLSSLPLDQRFAVNMEELNDQIQLFLRDRGKTTLVLQPMDKWARAEVHALADAYSLKSKSKGKEGGRFPTLIKTSKSGVVVDLRKAARVVRSNQGARFGNDAGRSDFKNKNKRMLRGKEAKRTVGQNGGGALGPKNRDGEQVGFGADKIGADNIGHRLLAAMGWSEGMGIGATGGMADPVSATVKVSKGGLGF